MRSKLGKGIAVFCGILLAIGIVCCFMVKSDEMISTVVIFALVYAVYLIALSKKLRREAEEKKQTPLKRK